MHNDQPGLCAIHGFEKPVFSKQVLNTFVQSVVKEFEVLLENAVCNFLSTQLCSCANKTMPQPTGSPATVSTGAATPTRSFRYCFSYTGCHDPTHSSPQPTNDNEGPAGTPVIRHSEQKAEKCEAVRFDSEAVASLVELSVLPLTGLSEERALSFCSTAGKAKKRKNDVSPAVYHCGKKQAPSTCSNKGSLLGIHKSDSAVVEEPVSASTMRYTVVPQGPTHRAVHLKNLSPRVPARRQNTFPPVRSRLKTENDMALRHLKRSGWVSRKQLEKRRREVGLFSQTPCTKDGDSTPHNQEPVRRKSLQHGLPDDVKQGDLTPMGVRSVALCEKVPHSPQRLTTKNSAVLGALCRDAQHSSRDNSRCASFTAANKRKEAREISCSQCEGFYAAFNNQMPDTACSIPLHGESASFVQKRVGLELSKHRAYEFPPPTPAGYWDVDFPESLTTLATQSRCFK